MKLTMPVTITICDRLGCSHDTRRGLPTSDRHPANLPTTSDSCEYVNITSCVARVTATYTNLTQSSLSSPCLPMPPHRS